MTELQEMKSLQKSFLKPLSLNHLRWNPLGGTLALLIKMSDGVKAQDSVFKQIAQIILKSYNI